MQVGYIIKKEKRENQIKSNIFICSGELSKASTDDIQEIIDYGIKTIYDLRNPYEQQIQINHPQFEIYGFNISQSTERKKNAD